MLWVVKSPWDPQQYTNWFEEPPPDLYQSYTNGHKTLKLTIDWLVSLA